MATDVTLKLLSWDEVKVDQEVVDVDGDGNRQVIIKQDDDTYYFDGDCYDVSDDMRDPKSRFLTLPEQN